MLRFSQLKGVDINIKLVLSKNQSSLLLVYGHIVCYWKIGCIGLLRFPKQNTTDWEAKTTEIFLFHSSGGQKVKIKVPSVMSDEESLPGSRWLPS